MVCMCVLSSLVWGQKGIDNWQEQVRKSAQEQDWNAAIELLDREIVRQPENLDLKSWRARILLWSGHLREAQQLYLEILGVSADDPDNWLGLATVYSRGGRNEEARKALDRALALDPMRSDIHTARGRALEADHCWAEAKMEFQRALELDPRSIEARRGLRSVEPVRRHELRIRSSTDLFSFASANHDEEVSLTSHWTPRWSTTAGAGFYRWGAIGAERLSATVTGKLPRWGAITFGGATAHDNAIVPKVEANIGYDEGWKLSSTGTIRGVEADYEQHWYWYSTARILTVNQMLIFYLPADWTWGLRVTGARSGFSGTGTEWRPSGMSRISFPIVGSEEHRVAGNLFFAVGTENFAQVTQIGRFSSQTYGGALRFQFTKTQDVTGDASYQKRTQYRSETSFELSYGIHF